MIKLFHIIKDLFSVPKEPWKRIVIPPHVKGKAYIGGIEFPFETQEQGFFFDVTYQDSWTELNMPSGTTLLQSGAIYQVDYMMKGLPQKKEGDVITQSNVVAFRRKK